MCRVGRAFLASCSYRGCWGGGQQVGLEVFVTHVVGCTEVASVAVGGKVADDVG